MKSFYKHLKEHATKIINCDKKEMKPLTIEENKLYHEQIACKYAKKNLVLMTMIKDQRLLSLYWKI